MVTSTVQSAIITVLMVIINPFVIIIMKPCSENADWKIQISNTSHSVPISQIDSYTYGRLAPSLPNNLSSLLQTFLAFLSFTSWFFKWLALTWSTSITLLFLNLWWIFHPNQNHFLILFLIWHILIP